MPSKIALALIPTCVLIIAYIALSPQPDNQSSTSSINETNQLVKQHSDAPMRVESVNHPPNTDTDDEQSLSHFNGFIVIEKPQWKFETGISNHVKTLKLQIANGNDEARYIYAKNLRYCFNAPLDESRFEQKLANAYQLEDSSRTIEQITAQYEYCQGLDKAELNSVLIHLEQAAASGHVVAQEEFGRTTSKFYMQLQQGKSLSRNDYIARRDKFLAHKEAFLISAAKHGSISALQQLSNSYHSQNYGLNGHIKSYALNKLIVELTNDDQIYNRYSFFINRQFDQLTADERDKANALSDEWRKQIEKNGTLYF